MIRNWVRVGKMNTVVSFATDRISRNSISILLLAPGTVGPTGRQLTHSIEE
jgi:hypothetical protein